LALQAHPEEPLLEWRAICSEIRQLVGDSTYEIWIAPIEFQAWDGELLLLKAPAGTQRWVSDRFGRALELCARQILGAGARVAFDGSKQSATRTAQRSLAPAQVETGGAFNPRYSFEQFIIGEGNRLAHGAALAVAEFPGQAYNPLFLHAPPGLGKTHLLHAIGNYVRTYGGGGVVRYTTAEAFTNHFLAALGARELEPFKRAYRDADVLLIDDVQFLASKAKTEEEFFHTFNAVYENGRQLVLTCDRLPRALVAIEERLRERFEAGLVADITAPDQATRVAILRKRAELDHLDITDDAVLELIAERVTNNVRALEGALIRVVAHHSLTRRPLDLALTRGVMDAMYPPSGSEAPSIEDVKVAVAAHFGLTVDELVSPSRTARIAWPRQLALHLARELSSSSLNDIGRAFGGRNHATVIHACKRVSERLRDDQHAADELSELSKLVCGGHADRNC
jgi:chromosomal replication initiator protein